MDKNELFVERQDRIRRAIALEPVDRIPAVYAGDAFAPRFTGLSLARYCADPEAALQSIVGTLEALEGLDGINRLVVGRIALGLSEGWLSPVAVPGRDLPEDSLWQVKEDELFGPEDYESILSVGWRKFSGNLLPRLFDMDEYQDNKLWIKENARRAVHLIQDKGFVVVSFGGARTPFESLCGARSMSKFFLDLYQRPDEVQAVMDSMVSDAIEGGVRASRLSGVKATWVGGWRSASAMLAPKLWDRFVFPYLEQVVNGLADQGIVSVLHFDQDWTRDLARLRELPAKSCILNLDGMTDVRKAKEILGDRMAIMGDVPSTLFACGNPEDVYRYVEDLVRDVGPQGLILCPGCDAPVNTKPENMRAFVAAARECGS